MEQSLGENVDCRDLPIDEARARYGSGQALESRAGGHPQARRASVSGEAFPAVIVPLPLFLSKAGCSLARRSRLVSARGKPSRDILRQERSGR